jgi:hypothetical protein
VPPESRPPSPSKREIDSASIAALPVMLPGPVFPAPGRIACGTFHSSATSTGPDPAHPSRTGTMGPSPQRSLRPYYRKYACCGSPRESR